MNPESKDESVDGSALRRLLDYIDEEQAKRCRRILAAAEKEADDIMAGAWKEARLSIRRVAVREKAHRDREVARARAEVRNRLRRDWFRLVRRELDDAWPVLRQAFVEHWRASLENRRQWLSATLDTATHALGPGLWHVQHPEDWAMVEGMPIFRDLKRQYEVLEIHFQAASHPAGFLVTCGDVSVSSTVDGLLSRKNAIEGIWLAALHAEGALNAPMYEMSESGT